jgi:serine/threonine protein kinase
MDSYKAKRLESLLRGKQISSYRIIELINNGKSAAVFKSMGSNNKLYAIKIFDNELVEQFGHEIQETRITQEIGLKGHQIPNLVCIIDGGKYNIDGLDYYYIVMEYITGVNLYEFIKSKQYDIDFVLKVFETLINTSEALLANGIAHRDIKSENIMICDNGNIILMDLGVLKLIGSKSFTDQEVKQFIGTLRNAPPEFLTRIEQDTIDGWRAVNLYQIGTVIFELLMKKPLFNDKTPYPNLVLAIKEDIPIVSNNTYSFNLQQITRDLLTKDYNKRLALCTIDRIKAIWGIHLTHQPPTGCVAGFKPLACLMISRYLV